MKEQNPKKQHIIQATINILKQSPIEEVTMRNIAKEAGLTTGAIYHHYKNKEELYYSVMQETLHFSKDLYTNIINESPETTGDELLTVINNNVRDILYKKEEQKFNISILSDILKHKGNLKEKYTQDYQEIITSVSELIIKAFNLEDNPNKTYMAHFLIAAIDGIALQQAINVVPEDMDEMIEIFIKFFEQSIPNFLRKSSRGLQRI